MLSSNNEYPHSGKIEWIGLRPSRDRAQNEVHTVKAVLGKGLIGDRYSGANGQRDITLIQKEHLEVIAKLLSKVEIDPSLLRRNLVVSNINLISLKGKKIRIGETELEVTGACAPCSKMEKNLGPGGYNAMRGHGGITARILKTGMISVGDTLEVIR